MSFFDDALWNPRSLVWLPVALMTLLYMTRLRTNVRKTVSFLVAMSFLVIAFVSPLGVLSSGYLFSAHMTQHLILLLVVPLFGVLSLPGREAFEHEVGQRMEPLLRLLAVPAFGWIAGLGTMWFWHVPSLCSAATEHTVIGAIRSTTFLLAGVAFWWPVYAPIERCRLPSPAAIVYLFSACLGCTLLGIYITFSTVSVCPAFANPVDRIGIMTMLYDAGFTPAADQQLAGLLMWVPPCMLYVGAIISVLCRWFAADHPADDVKTIEGTVTP